MAANKALRKLLYRIEELKKEIYRLEEQYQGNESYYERQIGEARESANRAIANAQWERQQAEEREQHKEYEAHDLARKLQSARERGDQYDCDRYLRRLRNL